MFRRYGPKLKALGQIYRRSERLTQSEVRKEPGEKHTRQFLSCNNPSAAENILYKVIQRQTNIADVAARAFDLQMQIIRQISAHMNERQHALGGVHNVYS